MLRGIPVAIMCIGCGRAFFEQNAPTDAAADVQRATSVDASAEASMVDARADAPFDARADNMLDATGCQSATLSILADQDDGEIDLDSDSFLSQGEDVTPEQEVPGIYMGYWDYSLGGLTWGYFRFQLPPGLSSGATVRQAHLLLQGAFTINWMPASYALSIQLEQSSDAPVVNAVTSAPSESMGRSVDTPIRWPPSGGLDWQIGQPNQSPDLAAALQDLLDGTAIAEGAHIQLWLTGDQQARTEVSTYDFGRANGQAAQLFVEWCP